MLIFESASKQKVIIFDDRLEASFGRVSSERNSINSWVRKMEFGMDIFVVSLDLKLLRDSGVKLQIFSIGGVS